MRYGSAQIRFDILKAAVRHAVSNNLMQQSRYGQQIVYVTLPF